MFPGQGSQALGMGEKLFLQYKKEIETANKILGYDIVDICLKEETKLNQTQFTQPALYLVNALFFWEIRAKSPKKADYHIGHSLGEYNALLASEAFDFPTGLRLVKKRAELMQSTKNGGMAAVLGLETDALVDILKNDGDKVDIANYNSPGQIVISGKKEDLMSIQETLLEKGAKRVIPLNVSGAFHSRYMKEVAEEFRIFLDNFDFKPPVVPVIANVDAKIHTYDSLKDTLAAQIHSSVRWIDTILFLKKGEREFIEVGPGRVLSGLYRKFK